MNSDTPRSVILTGFLELQKDCTQSLSAGPQDSAFLQKCLMKCHGVTSNFSTNHLSGGQVSYYLQQYAEAILDYTYYTENTLTEEEFPEQNARERVAEIFAYLGKVSAMVNTISPDRQIEEVLGNEIAECLLWRKGALLYMYCSTVQENPERLSRNIDTYRQDLRQGVEYLQAMFKIRDPVLNTAPVPGDSDTIGLLKMGIYSDTHLLALMYIGDMCHWHIKHCTETDPTFPVKTIGHQVLDTYVKAVTTIPQLQGWNTDKAKELLKCFQS